MENPDEVTIALERFWRVNGKLLDALYSWKLPKELPIRFTPKADEPLSKATMRLRRALADQWATASRNQRRALAEWYVRDWGGVKRNHPSTLDEYVDTPAAELIRQKGFRGISSWSKVLAIQDPDRFAIYDARVGFALNAIQLVDSGKLSLFFPIPQGRNSTIVSSIKRLRNHRSFNEAPHVPREATYSTYLALLQNVRARTRAPIERVEMLLFAQSEDLARKLGG